MSVSQIWPLTCSTTGATRNCFLLWSTWFHPFFVGFVLLNLYFSVYYSIDHCLYFVILFLWAIVFSVNFFKVRLLVAHLVSSNFSNLTNEIHIRQKLNMYKLFLLLLYVLPTSTSVLLTFKCFTWKICTLIKIKDINWTELSNKR
jgi:hypothetical protein